jgi:hypothetical protein
MRSGQSPRTSVIPFLGQGNEGKVSFGYSAASTRLARTEYGNRAGATCGSMK